MRPKKKATPKQKEVRVKFALAAYKNIPLDVEERIYEELPDMIGSVETAEEIIADIVDMFHLERYKVAQHPFVELEQSIGTDNFIEVMLDLVRAVAQDNINSEVSEYIHDMGYKTPGTFISAIKRMSYMLPEKQFEDALRGTRFEIKTEVSEELTREEQEERCMLTQIAKGLTVTDVAKICMVSRDEVNRYIGYLRTKSDRDIRRAAGKQLIEKYKEPRTVMEGLLGEREKEEDIYTKLDALLRDTLAGYGLLPERVHVEADNWKPDLETIAAEVAAGRRTQEDAERFLVDQLEILRPIEEVPKISIPRKPRVIKPKPPVEVVDRGVGKYTVDEGIPILDLPSIEDRRKAARFMLKHYWSEIVTYGLPEFYSNHPEFGVAYTTKDLIRLFTQVAYEKMHLRRPKNIRDLPLTEWIITDSPLAKETIALIFGVGIHHDAFQNWFANDLYPSHIEKPARKIKPDITAAEFTGIFKTKISELSL